MADGPFAHLSDDDLQALTDQVGRYDSRWAVTPEQRARVSSDFRALLDECARRACRKAAEVEAFLTRTTLRGAKRDRLRRALRRDLGGAA